MHFHHKFWWIILSYQLRHIWMIHYLLEPLSTFKSKYNRNKFLSKNWFLPRPQCSLESLCFLNCSVTVRQAFISIWIKNSFLLLCPVIYEILFCSVCFHCKSSLSNCFNSCFLLHPLGSQNNQTIGLEKKCSRLLI